MNCREARRMVIPFINHELSDKETEQFLHHVEHCSDCMDELDTYFMVYRTIDTLDAGAHHRENDFRKMLNEEIRSEKRRILTRKILKASRILVMTLAEMLLLLCILIGDQERSEGLARRALHRVLYRAETVTETERSTETERPTDTQMMTETETEYPAE